MDSNTSSCGGCYYTSRFYLSDVGEVTLWVYCRCELFTSNYKKKQIEAVWNIYIYRNVYLPFAGLPAHPLPQHA